MKIYFIISTQIYGFHIREDGQIDVKPNTRNSNDDFRNEFDAEPGST